MKKITLIIVSLFFAVSINAQDAQDVSGAAKKLPKGERLLIGVYQDMWQDMPNDIDLRTINQGFTVSTMFDFPIKSSNFSLAPGIGVGVHNLFSDAMIPANSDSTVFSPIPDSISYDNNKLTLSYLDVPFEIRYRTKHEKKSKQFKIAIGGKVGLLLASHTKYKGDSFAEKNTKVKQKEFDIDNTENLRYGLTFRVGRGVWNLFGYYSLSKVFKDEKGPEIYPISAGIMLTPF